MNTITITDDGPEGVMLCEDATVVERPVMQMILNIAAAHAIGMIGTPYQGKCFRHQTRFIPSDQFNNTCPACYWEGQLKRREAHDENIHILRILDPDTSIVVVLPDGPEEDSGRIQDDDRGEQPGSEGGGTTSLSTTDE